MPRRPRIEIVKKASSLVTSAIKEKKFDSKKLEKDLIKAKNLEEKNSIIYQASQEGVS